MKTSSLGQIVARHHERTLFFSRSENMGTEKSIMMGLLALPGEAAPVVPTIDVEDEP